MEWSAVREGSGTLQTREHHRLTQLPSGDFDVESTLDTNGEKGSGSGRRVVFTGGKTFAGGRWGPMRARESDRGEEARRQRDQSFRMASDLLALFQPALRLDEGGSGEALGRSARRYRLSLGELAAGSASAALPAGPSAEVRPGPATAPDAAPDAATQRRLDFLAKRTPTALTGELLLDPATGLPLSVTLRGAFTSGADPLLRLEVALSARATAVGRGIASVQPPRDALADERRPRGVARALEAAGLRGGQRKATPQEDEDDSAP